MSTDTLLDVPQRKNPDIIDHWGSTSYNNISSARFDEITLDDGCRAHIDILEQKVLTGWKETHSPSDTPRTIIDENGIDTLGIAWSYNVERVPLKAVAPILRHRPGIKHLTDPRSSFKPDWAILDYNLSKKYHHAHKDHSAKYLVYTVGDSKLKQKWKSGWLSYPDSTLTVHTDTPYHKPGTPILTYQQTINIVKERLWPLRQLATYCRYSETRYAYLVTQTELVALRVRRIARNTYNHSAAIEYRAIPWSAHDQNKVTAHLAIWALGCMGMNDGHRAMEGPNNAVLTDMAKLTWWTKNVDGSFTNVISHRIIPGGEWAKITAGTTVHTDDAGGRSFTATFTAAPPLPGLAGKMANLKLDAAAAKKQPQSPAAPTSSSHPPAAAAPKKSYTKCTIGKKKYNVSKNPKGLHYLVMDNNKMKVQYTIMQNAAHKWVVKEDSKLVVVKME